MSDMSLPLVPRGHFVVGTVVPYATGAPIDENFLEEQGWMYCNGRMISRSDYPDLFAVIGTLHGGGDGTSTFTLPDYRGYLLRGVDDHTGRDPDAGSRTEPAPGGASGNRCGSRQGHATARPQTAFALDSAGNHSHQARTPQGYSARAVIGSYRSIWNDDDVESNSGGNHHHTVDEGGDAETRPGNAYVNFIIRYRA
ncbi:tail collar domain [Micromonospora pisi]|uniref:Tail collar domain n=1 Tax=Micromonospora pisi TaxID=589240 RepID=A0A495JV81_9ACTN|nr:phage tail protein [Micromonospora pisi]RKR92910.1 tail collar domain [Micromonospora pisi]